MFVIFFDVVMLYSQGKERRKRGARNKKKEKKKDEKIQRRSHISKCKRTKTIVENKGYENKEGKE